MTMKQSLRLNCLTLGLAGALLTGCVTLSVYPFYTAKDLTFDPALLGVWTETDKTDSDQDNWTFEKINDTAYRLTVKDDDEKTEFDARLFKLKDQLFLDCQPNDNPDFSTPGHVLLRVDRIQPSLRLRPLDYEWVEDLIEKKPKAIRHAVVMTARPKGDEAKEVLLTADTAELQKFVRQHLKTEAAWGRPIELKQP